MDNKNFDRVFYFTYSPSLTTGQFRSELPIDFSSITAKYDIVDIQQSPMQDKIIVTLFVRNRN